MNKKVILHSDAAKSYKCPVPGGASWQCGALQEASESRWEVGLAEAELCQGCYSQSPRGKAIYPLQGRHPGDWQYWKFLKDRVQINQNCRVGSAALRAKLRSAQYEYWHRNQDLWVATGALCSWEMTKFIQSVWSILSENKGNRTSCVLLSEDLFLLSVMRTNVFHLCKGHTPSLSCAGNHRAPSSYCAGKLFRLNFCDSNKWMFKHAWGLQTCFCNLFMLKLAKNHAAKWIYMSSCLYHICWTDTGFHTASCFECKLLATR